MDSLTSSLIISSVFALGLGFFVHPALIKVATKVGLIDVPSKRRRHAASIPVTGGFGILICWFAAFALFSYQEFALVTELFSSIWPVMAGMLILFTIGVIDDSRGLGPLPKFVFQSIAALIVLIFEPRVHELFVHWEGMLGDFGFLVWPLALVWLVGVTNAINLIDGLDGLAGSMSLIVMISIFTMSIWTGYEALAATIMISLSAPALISFLKFNWNPAKIFLGDNGSLPIGFLIAATSLMCRPQSKSWILIASLVLMLGYPILDMGLCVLRRYTKRQPLFKADRIHLHYRMLRLGLTPIQTVVILLSIGLFLQITSLSINLMGQPAAALGISLVVFSIFSLLYMVRSIEKWRVDRLYSSLNHMRGIQDVRKVEEHTVITVDLEPLFEAGLFEEHERCQQLLSAFELVLSSSMRQEDVIFINGRELCAVVKSEHTEASLEAFRERLEVKFESFLKLYEIQCSLRGFPIKFERKQMVIANGMLQPNGFEKNVVKSKKSAA